jgi:hypothetical protein
MAKPRKVGEPAGTYAAKPPAKRALAAPAQKTAASGARYADDATSHKAMDKIFETHEELLRKLALAEKRPALKARDATQPVVRYAQNQDVQKANEKLMQVHHKVLQKLAQ